MAGIKSLAKDTAIYGLSSIVGRFLNYLLVPLYTAVLPAASGGYGVVSNVYAYTALILVLLTFGMETGFFRFANKSDEDAGKVYANSLLFVGGLSLLHGFPTSAFCLAGIPGSSGLYCHDGVCGGTRFFPVHTFCVSAL